MDFLNPHLPSENDQLNIADHRVKGEISESIIWHRDNDFLTVFSQGEATMGFFPS